MTERRHRSITADDLRVWRGYIETAEALKSRLERRVQNDSNLSLGDYGVLLALSEAEGRTLRSSELAAVIGWERSRLSHHIGRMEKRGLVHRTPCQLDTRGSNVHLTDEGAAAFRRGSVFHLRAVQQLFISAFSAEQLTEIASASASLRSHLGLDDRAADDQSLLAPREDPSTPH